jgi:hypothetical protein
MKDYIVPFVAVFLACGIGFLALDAVIMGLQGLSLIFHG